MGLESGKYGVRKLVEERIGQAVARLESLQELPDIIGAERDECAILLDGNILLFEVPQSIKTFEGYCDFVTGVIRSYAGAFGTIGVVFDNPQHVPPAKMREQKIRDASHRMSLMRRGARTPGFTVQAQGSGTGISASKFIDTDEYTYADLLKVADCHDVMRHRASRLRLIDEVMHVAFRTITDEVKCAGAPLRLVLKGVHNTPRRSALDPREPSTIAHPPEALEHFQDDSRACKIGEGDIHLRELDVQVRRAPHTVEIKLISWITTDLDSLPIGVSYVAQLCENNLSGFKRIEGLDTLLADDSLIGALSVLCTRESFATRAKRARDGGLQDPVARYQLFDFKEILRMLYSACNPRTTYTRGVLSTTSIGFSIVCALGGCDYVEKSSAQRASNLFDALIARSDHAGGVKWLRPIVESNDVDAASAPLTKLLNDVARPGVAPKPNVAKHAAWTARYWQSVPPAGCTTSSSATIAACSPWCQGHGNNSRALQEAQRWCFTFPESAASHSV